MGKSALALDVAYDCLEATKTPQNKIYKNYPLFSGIFWVSAKTPLDLGLLLDKIAETKGEEELMQLPLADKERRVVSFLRTAPFLLIVDNFETISDLAISEFLKTLPETTKVIITSRRQDLPRALSISLKGLKKEEGVILLKNEGARLGSSLFDEIDNDLLQRIYQATSGMPLAIILIVGQVKNGRSIDTVVEELENAKDSIFDYLFTSVWGMLSQNSQKAAMSITLFVTPVSDIALAAACGLTKEETAQSIEQLSKLSLIEVLNDLKQPRYNLHPLVRFFFTSKLILPENAIFKSETENRFIAFYKEFTEENGGLSLNRKYYLLEPEMENILTAIQVGVRKKCFEEAAETFENLSHLLAIRGYWDRAFSFAVALRETFLANGLEHRAARLNSWPISWIYLKRGQVEYAEKADLEALKILENSERRSALIYTKRNLGKNALARGDFDRAEMFLKEAYDFYSNIIDSGTWKDVLALSTAASLASVLLRKGKFEEAKLLCTQNLTVARNLDDPERVSALLDSLAEVSVREGNYKDAIIYWEEALTLARRVNRVDKIFDYLVRLSYIEKRLGNRSSSSKRSEEIQTITVKLNIESRKNDIEIELSKLCQSQKLSKR